MHFDDLDPEEAQKLLDAMFPPGSNARAIIDSTPPHERAAFDQAMAAAKERRRLHEATATPDELAEEDTLAAEGWAAMEAMTPDDWASFEADLRDTEREILRDRGIEPPE